MAQKLYIKYCSIFKPEAVRDIYDQEDDFEALSTLFIKECYQTKSNAVCIAEYSHFVKITKCIF